jgi:hypothetical protein
MRTQLSGNPITVALLALGGVLALLLSWQLLFPPHLKQETAPGVQPKAPSVAGKGEFSLPPLKHYQEIVERPLFIQTRKPVPPADVKTTAKSSTRSALPVDYLAAIVITPQKRFVLLRGPKDKKIFRLAKGEEKDGWTLHEIKDEEVLFSRDNEKELLRLMRKTSDQGKLLAQRARLLSRKSQNAAKSAKDAAKEKKKTSNSGDEAGADEEKLSRE